MTTVPSADVDLVSVVNPMSAEPVETTGATLKQPVELLPVDDEEYSPSNFEELARAVKVLVNDIEDDSIEEIWKLFKNVVNRVAKSKDNLMRQHKQTQKKFTENFVRKLIRSKLFEARAEEDYEPTPEDIDAIEKKQWGKKREPVAVLGLTDDDADMLAKIRKSAGLDKADIEADEDEDEDYLNDKPRKKYNTTGEGMSLKDIAIKAGFAGPSGVKNLLYKIENQLEYFSSLDEVWFKKLMDSLADAYVEELISALGPNPDESDVEFLLDLTDDDSPDRAALLTSPKFREWSHLFLKDLYKNQKGKKAPKSYAKFR